MCMRRLSIIIMCMRYCMDICIDICPLHNYVEIPNWTGVTVDIWYQIYRGIPLEKYGNSTDVVLVN